MRALTAAALATFLCVGGAWGADVVAEGGASGTGAVAAFEADGTRELKWDSGSGRWVLDWYTGGGSWVGNDFDISTIRTYRVIKAVRFDSMPDWPNGRWDGFRFGIYLFSGVPGKLLWPTSGGGYFFKPTGPRGWKDAPVNWALPAGVTSFVAAMEQYYDHPDCDPYLVDNNYSFTGHSWQYYGGTWRLHVGYQGYRNVMLRVIVEGAAAVAPTSLGRVKALYY